MAIREHQNITLSCKAEGFPEPRITWRREDGREFAVDRRKKGKVNNESFRNSTIQIYRIEISHCEKSGFNSFPRCAIWTPVTEFPDSVLPRKRTPILFIHKYIPRGDQDLLPQKLDVELQYWKGENFL